MQYERNQNRLKICALCDNRINSGHVVCEEHIQDMEQYRNQEWFIELCRMQQRQYEIDVEEFRFMKNLNHTPTLQKRSNTRSKQLTNQNKKDILFLYDHGLGDRRISKQLKLNYNTVRTFLWRHRKNNKNATQLLR